MNVGQPVFKVWAFVTAFMIAAAIVFFLTRTPPVETSPGLTTDQAGSPAAELPDSTGAPADSETEAAIGMAAPPPPQPEALMSPAAPAPTPSSGEQSGTGSLIPVTAMPEQDVYNALITAMATGDTEIGQVALRSGTSFESKACRAYAFATTSKRAEAQSLLSGLIDSAEDLRQQSFLLVVQAELAFRSRDIPAATKLFDEAVQRASEIPEGTEGIAFPYFASARFFLATGDKEKAKQLSQAGLSQATLSSERTLASKFQ